MADSFTNKTKTKEINSKLQTVSDENSFLQKKLTNELWYSVRRYYIDAFFLEKITILKKGAKVIDLGGKKKNKRGEFDIDKYGFDVKYVNIDESTEPDFLADIKAVPVKDSSFDAVVLAEVLEHVPDPIPILKEAYRILDKDGTIFITTPFVYNVHADPYDYARYTDYWYNEKLSEIGFESIEIFKQSLLWGVVANILKTWAYSLEVEGQPSNTLKRKLTHKFVKFITKKSLKWDFKNRNSENPIYKNYTTGYAVIAKKIK